MTIVLLYLLYNGWQLWYSAILASIKIFKYSRLDVISFDELLSEFRVVFSLEVVCCQQISMM